MNAGCNCEGFDISNSMSTYICSLTCNWVYFFMYTYCIFEFYLITIKIKFYYI